MNKATSWITIIISFLLVYFAQVIISDQNLAAKPPKPQNYILAENLFKELTLTTTKGNKIKLSEHTDKIVILNFWASWCRPCLSEFESLKKLIEKFPKEKILVIGINNDEEEPLKAVKKIEKKLNLNFESVVDTSSITTTKFQISAIPASIIFNKGKVIHFVNKEFNFLDSRFIKTLDLYTREE